MSREKQIEEMARILNKANGLDDAPAWYNDFIPDAEALYNAGYRKQSEAIDEFAECIKNEFSQGLYPNDYLEIKQIDFCKIIDELAKAMKGGVE